MSDPLADREGKLLRRIAELEADVARLEEQWVYVLEGLPDWSKAQARILAAHYEAEHGQ
jgi:hypothetical protein